MNSPQVNVGHKDKRPVVSKLVVKDAAEKWHKTRHLSDDTKRLLKNLEDQFHRIAFKLEAAADHATVQADLGLAEFEKHWDSVLEAFSRKAEPLRKIPSELRAKVDRSKVKVHLAEMDAKDAVEKALKSLGRMQAEMHILKTKVGEDAKDIFQRLGRSYKKFVETWER